MATELELHGPANDSSTIPIIMPASPRNNPGSTRRPADDETCAVEPFEAMVTICTNEILYERAWEAVHRAQKVGRRISSEPIERLRRTRGVMSDGEGAGKTIGDTPCG
jgi:hypothetical protein